MTYTDYCDRKISLLKLIGENIIPEASQLLSNAVTAIDNMRGTESTMLQLKKKLEETTGEVSWSEFDVLFNIIASVQMQNTVKELIVDSDDISVESIVNGICAKFQEKFGIAYNDEFKVAITKLIEDSYTSQS